ncbi:polyprenyl synthetase family protein [Clostridium oceanicum]|uniref:Polyprenyl synthetase family protein n=1 Tax=Clostridium oceanicum TaxID=1543 RepID=A0ABN1JNL0_9CLOT
MENIKILKKEVDSWIENYFLDKGCKYNKRIYEAMEYSIKAGGKRIRPILLLIVYSMYKKDYSKVLNMAASIEMIHTYSLIHDDLPAMDNDDLRRGKPTNHKVFGEAIGILAGDALLNEAMNIMFDYSVKNKQLGIEASMEISKAAGAEGMIAGQVVDILSENKSIPIEKLNYMHENKTGALIKASIKAGAILSNAPKEDINNFEKFGKKLGMAFQIRDDILDVVGNSKTLGKNVKSDEENHKTTFVTVYGLDKCNEMCEKLTKECLDILSNIGKNTGDLEKLTLFLLKREF